MFLLSLLEWGGGGGAQCSDGISMVSLDQVGLTLSYFPLL